MRIGADLLILALFAAPTAVCAFLLSGATAITFTWIVLVFTAGILLIMFWSVISRGLGEDRSLADVLIVSFGGIGALITQFGVLYRWTGILDAKDQTSDSLFETVYFSVVTWTTLGYGDYRPAPDSRYIVMVEALLGYLTMALLIVIVVEVIEQSRGEPPTGGGPSRGSAPDR